jgi:hypothetical protein
MANFKIFGTILLVVLSIGVARADFLQVSTSFGNETALRDNSTQLDWLHLNFTRGYSYSQMQSQLANGGTFQGWRYATSRELLRLFIDFDGVPNGLLTGNDVLAIQFMNALGGPTYIADHPSTGFHREAATAMLDIPFSLGHAVYGYIAVDNFAGAKIDPSLQGSTVDWYANPNSAHWLIREQTGAQVPEPASYLLVASGLVVSVRLRKRGRNRSLLPQD